MEKPVHQKIWDLPVRLFHWTLVVLVLLLWLTGEFGGFDVTLPLPGVGDTYLSNMDVHALAGQGVFILVLFRLLWGIWGSTTARFGHFVRHPVTVARELVAMLKGRIDHSVGHNPAGGAMIVVLLLLLAAQSITGMFSADDFFFEGPLVHLVSSDTSESLTGIHGLLFSGLQVLIVLHILAVIYHLVRGHNLIGAMFTGKRPAPQPTAQLKFSPGWLALVSLGLSAGLLLLLRSL